MLFDVTHEHFNDKPIKKTGFEVEVICKGRVKDKI